MVPVSHGEEQASELAGTLTVPRDDPPPYPAAVTITDSSGQDRDESLWPLVPEYRPFSQIAASPRAESQHCGLMTAVSDRRAETDHVPPPKISN